MIQPDAHMNYNHKLKSLCSVRWTSVGLLKVVSGPPTSFPEPHKVFSTGTGRKTSSSNVYDLSVKFRLSI
jgi:hypothetical protein